eukprot:COSAG01_NODE_162_length_23597_cov_21.924130_22_plen_172_part_00
MVDSAAHLSTAAACCTKSCDTLALCPRPARRARTRRALLRMLLCAPPLTAARRIVAQLSHVVHRLLDRLVALALRLQEATRARSVARHEDFRTSRVARLRRPARTPLPRLVTARTSHSSLEARELLEVLAPPVRSGHHIDALAAVLAPHVLARVDFALATRLRARHRRRQR